MLLVFCNCIFIFQNWSIIKVQWFSLKVLFLYLIRAGGQETSISKYEHVCCMNMNSNIPKINLYNNYYKILRVQGYRVIIVVSLQNKCNILWFRAHFHYSRQSQEREKKPIRFDQKHHIFHINLSAALYILVKTKLEMGEYTTGILYVSNYVFFSFKKPEIIYLNATTVVFRDTSIQQKVTL